MRKICSMNRIRTFASVLCLGFLAFSAAPLRADSFAVFPHPARSGVQGSTMVWQFKMIPIDGVAHALYFLAPFPAQIQIYCVRTGRLVTSVSTGSTGEFKVSLRPGEYRLVPKTQYLNPNIDPQPGDVAPYLPKYQAPPVIIRVLPNSYQRVQIEYRLNQAA